MISGDELLQILFFLPAPDICHYSQTNSIAYDFITHNQALWTELLERDFASIKELNREPQSTSMTDQNCCPEMGDYCALYQFPFKRVTPSYDTKMRSKIVFIAPGSPMNKPVIDALITQELVIPTVCENSSTMSSQFMSVGMKSVRPNTAPDVVLEFWTSGSGPERFHRLSRMFYRRSECMVVTIDTRDAWNEGSYSTAHQYASYGPNSLSRALASLKDAKSMCNLDDSENCTGVSIVGVGNWSHDAPISKERFLRDCVRAFEKLPLDYFELTTDNAAFMSNLILKRFYACHRQSVLGVTVGPSQPTEQAPTSFCILS